MQDELAPSDEKQFRFGPSNDNDQLDFRKLKLPGDDASEKVVVAYVMECHTRINLCN